VDCDSDAQRWMHFKSVFPAVNDSENFTNFSTPDPNTLYQETPICLKLTATPPEFQKKLLSGVKSSSLNTDLTQAINLNVVPSSPIIATSFLRSSVLVYLDNNTKDLKIQF